MKALSIFGGFFSAMIAITTWAEPSSTEGFTSGEYFNEDASPADIYLKLSSMRCENCTLIVRDLIEVGAIGNTIGAVKSALNGDLHYTFRLTLLTECDRCYRAAHFWEMSMLNRAAANEEIHRWLESEESKPLIEYFSKL